MLSESHAVRTAARLWFWLLNTMPIFQDDLDHPDFRPLIVEPPSTSSLRRFSDESLRTDLCEGPVPDSLPDVPGQKKNPDHDSPTSDRQALIEKLKRGESPTWIPSRHVCHVP